MTDMISMIQTLGDQLRWASQLEAPSVPGNFDILVAGMGGSGIAGDYARAVGGGTGSRISVHKGYAPLPEWAIRTRPLVIALSYSGNTEETLDVAMSAYELGLPVATVTTGGQLAQLSQRFAWPTIEVPADLQPRAAIGYLLGAVLGLMHSAGAIGDQRLDLIEAANLATTITEEGSEGWTSAAGIARALSGRIPIIYGGGSISGAAAQRWKTQINENAKIPAWWSLLPELNHNELVGWETMPDMTKEHLAIVPLTDRADHKRVAARFAHSRDLTEHAVPWLDMVHSGGTSPVARLVSLTAVGDLVSWMIADNAGVDPTPVAAIEKLKKLLTED